MSKRAYCHALELRIRRLMDQAAALRLRSERATFVEKFRCSWEIRRLERRKEELEARLSDLGRKEDNFWEDIKANIRGVADELPSGVERWMERLDRSYAAGSAHPEGAGDSVVARDHAG
jgi:chromosome condensin MukBEF ATPase and DNA-binding subunit MukB